MNKKLETATSKAIHICNSHEPTLKPKIAKKYALPTHRRNEICSKFERVRIMK